MGGWGGAASTPTPSGTSDSQFGGGGGGSGIMGAIIGGLFGAKGQSKANKANLALARENRAWQERMSNTAYTRAAKDLENAGLNRILALGSPSSTPAGNVAQMANVGAAAVDGATKGGTSAIATRMASQELRNMKMMFEQGLSNISLQGKQKAKLLEETNEVEARIKLLQAQLPGANAEADFWKSLQSSGGTAKGALRLLPFLKMIIGK